MEAPLHKACGTRHWTIQDCPLIGKAPRRETALRELQRVTAPVSTSANRVSKPANTLKVVSTKANGATTKLVTCPHCGETFDKPKVDRNAQSRELMRKLRAEKKADGAIHA